MAFPPTCTCRHFSGLEKLSYLPTPSRQRFLETETETAPTKFRAQIGPPKCFIWKTVVILFLVYFFYKSCKLIATKEGGGETGSEIVQRRLVC